MLMKKIFILLMVGSLLFSCQITDVLNQEPPHNLTPDNAITDEKSAETALTGIYGEQIGYESYMSIGNHAMTAGILQRNDNPGVVVSIYYIENRLPELNLVGAAYTPFWDAFNTIINSSTKLLAVLEGMSDNLFTDGRKTTMMGEIRFLRGWYMFDLLRMFGPLPTQLDSKAIPYKETISVSAPGMLTGNEVIEKVLTDLAEAESILKNWDPAVSEGMLMAVNDDDHDNDGNTYRFRGLRLNYYAVVALKARVYLWAGNKTEALKYAKMIIENPEAETGEIQVRGENVMVGYYKNPEATQEVFTEDGWLRTGDLGTMDASGNIFIRGRLKSMILSSSGQNIFPEELEAKLNNLPFILESLVIERNKKLVALVYADYEALDSLGLNNPDNLKTIMDENLKNLNNNVAAYEKVSKIQLYPTEFEKTPKRSIKRYLYNSIAVD